MGFFPFTASCRKPERKTEKPVIAVTVPPLAFFVRQLAGEVFETVIMAPPGANLHAHEPSPVEVAKFSAAAAYIKTGARELPVESVFLSKITAATPAALIIDAGKGIEPLPDDPHLWLSFSSGIVMAENIRAGLCRLVPEKCPVFNTAAAALISQITFSQNNLKGKYPGLSGRSFLTFHPAWGYLARDFGLQQLAIEEEGKEPGPAELGEKIQTAKEKGIKTILVAPQFDQRAAQTVAAELGGQLVEADPLSPDWLQNLEKVVAAIAVAEDNR